MQHATHITSYYACVARATNNKQQTPNKSKVNAEADSNAMDSMDMKCRNAALKCAPKHIQLFWKKEKEKKKKQEGQSLVASAYIVGKMSRFFSVGKR